MSLEEFQTLKNTAALWPAKVPSLVLAQESCPHTWSASEWPVAPGLSLGALAVLPPNL